MENLIEKYANNIFERQTENEIQELLLIFCRENDGEINKISEAIKLAKEFSTQDHWECIRYNRHGIKIMLNHLI